jgi:hypothetical protein
MQRRFLLFLLFSFLIMTDASDKSRGVQCTHHAPRDDLTATRSEQGVVCADAALSSRGA